MTYHGEVRGGVVVLDEGASLPDGTKVAVQLLTPAAPEDPLLRMASLAVETGIPDLGTNIDHYLYGHPRREDEKG
jgi:hypothetical protein